MRGRGGDVREREIYSLIICQRLLLYRGSNGVKLSMISPSAGSREESERRVLDERQLLVRYHTHGDLHAREALVARFLPLAKSLARRYQRAGESQEDLVQVATIGLINAIDRFDPERTTAFSSFAVPTILGELKRYFRDKSWAIRVPRELQELVLKVDNTTEALARTLGRTPSIEEIAQALEVSHAQILEAQEASGAYRTASLDQQSSGDDQEGGGYAERFGEDDPGYEQAEDHATIESLLEALSPREQEILRLRFYHDLSQSEISEQVGCSQMHVSRMIKQALTRLSVLARHPRYE